MFKYSPLQYIPSLVKGLCTIINWKSISSFLSSNLTKASITLKGWLLTYIKIDTNDSVFHYGLILILPNPRYSLGLISSFWTMIDMVGMPCNIKPKMMLPVYFFFSMTIWMLKIKTSHISLLMMPLSMIYVIWEYFGP